MTASALRPRAALALPLLLASLVACTRTAAPAPAAVAAAYGELVERTYADVLTTAERLQAAVDRFVAAPSAPRHEAAKRAWLDARMVYGQSEAFRFYDGPIDGDGGPEGLVNGWPLDESYIDYVDGQPTAGIINDPTIEITAERLAGLNEGGAGDILKRGQAFDKEKAIATGYHAIEFLLWGQDRDEFGPGARPWTDYVEPGGTAPNAARRGRYLKVVTDLLVEHLTAVHAAWAPDADNYRGQLLAGDPKTVLRHMLTGMGVLTKGELAGERIDVALDTQDQEDEHSCFSDNTHVDIIADVLALRNVYLGTYGVFSGPSLSGLVAARDAALDRSLRELLDRSVRTAEALTPPFDQLVRDRAGQGWKDANALVQTLFELGDKIVLAGKALELGNISVTLPE
jgi:putative iron-regulated protein